MNSLCGRRKGSRFALSLKEEYADMLDDFTDTIKQSNLKFKYVAPPGGKSVVKKEIVTTPTNSQKELQKELPKQHEKLMIFAEPQEVREDLQRQEEKDATSTEPRKLGKEGRPKQSEVNPQMPTFTRAQTLTVARVHADDELGFVTLFEELRTLEWKEYVQGIASKEDPGCPW